MKKRLYIILAFCLFGLFTSTSVALAQIPANYYIIFRLIFGRTAHCGMSIQPVRLSTKMRVVRKMISANIGTKNIPFANRGLVQAVWVVISSKCCLPMHV